MPKAIDAKSLIIPASMLNLTSAEALDALRLRAGQCRKVAEQMVDQAKYAFEIDDTEHGAVSASLLEVELVRSAIYDVGAVLLEELRGITEILEKHELGGLKLRGPLPRL